MSLAPEPSSSPLILVREACAVAYPGLRSVRIRVARRVLAKRLWRGVAEDGLEFGFELEAPLTHGAVVWQTTTDAYVIEQESEPVLGVSLALAPSAAAAIGWAVGNLHLELSADLQRLYTPDEPEARRLFERLGIEPVALTVVFTPGRFARGSTAPCAELGGSHRH